MDVRPYTTELWPALEKLFGRAGASNGCWCMYWGHTRNLFPGVATVFTAAGFTEVTRRRPDRPVMRRR